MTPKNQELRDSLKQIETTITSALAHQPEDDAQCGQFLYDALVSVFNTADLAAHTYRGVTTYCRPIAAAPTATPTPNGAAPTAPVPSVPEVPSVPSNDGEHETLPEIEEDLRSDKRRFSNSDATAIASRIQEARKRQEEAHQKELDALNEQITDLRQQRDLWSKRAAELVEKCNEQYAKIKRELATTEKSSAVGDSAKLPKTVDLRFDICKDIELVLKIGRDFQNKDGFRGAHYDTVKLLCDAIEYQQEQLKTKVGDAAKLREAAEKTRASLEEALQILNGISDEEAGGLNARIEDVADAICEVTQQIIPAALAEPPRNCDVGTAEERAKRYAWHCDAHLRDDGGKPCTNCPCCGKIPYGRCEFAWAQLPYESEAAK